MSEAPLMLGVSGLRGIVGRSLTPEVAARFAGVVGSWVVESGRGGGGGRGRGVGGKAGGKRPLVVVGFDGRLGGAALFSVVTASLQAAGCDVLAMGTVMTPSVGVIVDLAGAAAGVVVTASHNPQEWNGIKVIAREAGVRRGAVSASAPSKALADDIIARFRGTPPAWCGPEGLGVLRPRLSLAYRHEEQVAGLIRERGDLARLRRRKFRVALDTVAGSGAVWGGRFLEAVGCRVHELYPVLKFGSGKFPHAPEPTRENLGALRRATKKFKADVGFAQDPDADRLAIVDERGEYIGEEYTLVLAAEALLSESATQRGSGKGRKDRVLVANLSTSRMIDDVAARHGARVVRTAVGEANVVEVMKREAAAGKDVVVGGEGNGGVIWPRVTYVRDSLSAMGLVLSLMARRGQRLSEIVASMPSYAIEKRKVELARKEEAKPAVEKIAAFYGKRGSALHGGVKIDRQDGVRVDFVQERAWLHVRASNTEPIMRLIAEAPTAAGARGVLEEAEKVIGG